MSQPVSLASIDTIGKVYLKAAVNERAVLAVSRIVGEGGRGKGTRFARMMAMEIA